MAPQRNRRPGFSRRAQYGLFLGYVSAVGGALVGICLLLISTFQPQVFSVVRDTYSEITTPVASALDWARRGIVGIPGGISDYLGVVGENRRLKQQIADGEALIQRARTLNQENRRLRALLQVRDSISQPVVAARLVASTASSTRRYATLNAGAWQGVKRSMPVRGPDGLIGQVIEVSPNSARVLLIVDPDSVVPVRRTRDGLPAIAAGRGDGLIDIRSASIASVPFRPGDTFVTSGTGGIFPPNITVARVLRQSHDGAVAEPAANPDALDFALVQQVFIEPTPEPSGRPQDMPPPPPNATDDTP